jgi:cysteine desulfurase family protein (TIGR01976 family)
MMEVFDRLLPWIRAQFPQIDSLRDGRRRVYLDNAAGTLVPETVADAMREAALWANPQPGRAWPPSPETRAEQHRARSLLADFLNASPADRIALSESTTSSLYKLREALEPSWHAGDNLVVTDCDHFANISPWEWRARWEVRRARMLPDGHLDLDHFASLPDSGTRLVALAVAGNALGTVLRVEEAVRRVRERAPDAIIVLDAVHAAPHLPLDVQALGADALAFSTYKLFGPLCGVLWLREGLAARLDPFHVEPHSDAETLLEWGTLNGVTVAGVRAALEYLQRLGEQLDTPAAGCAGGYSGPRRLFKAALAAIRGYEAGLSRRVLEGLRGNGLPLFGVHDPERAAERVPTFAFAVPGVADADVERRFWEEGGLQVSAGNHYAAAVTRGLDRASVARASFAHYNTAADADALLRMLTWGGNLH